ncbi:MAG: DinB family protein [Planctomycetota bacterium]
MSEKTKWRDKKFDFSFPVEEYPKWIDRLRNSPGRMDALIRSLPKKVLTRRDGESWSIQENAGHLADTEELFIARIEDFRNKAETLAPAEMSGQKTFKSRHNENDVETVLAAFKKERATFMEAVDALPPEVFGWSAMHPRLQKPMRLCDMLLFMTEHDDYHMEQIKKLIARFMPES